MGWRRGAWDLRAAWVRREPDYAGSRPEPVSLTLARFPPKGRAAWSVAWSTAEARHPWRAQRVEADQAWAEGGRWKLEQRLRVPWTPAGIAGDLFYQLALAAEL